MKHTMTIVVVAIATLLLAAKDASATLWCGKGPTAKLDYPCEDYSDAVDAAAAKYQTQWMTLSGVAGVSGVLNDRGGYMEIDVIVDPPSLIPGIRAVLPTEADGFPVRVISQPHGVFLMGGADQNECPPSSGANNSAADDALADPGTDDDDGSKLDPLSEALLDDETQAWTDLPGVAGVSAAQCGRCDCDPPKIAVEVQPAMMESVRKQIPSSKFGVPIVLQPFR
jgi:hypothetical protein